MSTPVPGPTPHARNVAGILGSCRRRRCPALPMRNALRVTTGYPTANPGKILPHASYDDKAYSDVTCRDVLAESTSKKSTKRIAGSMRHLRLSALL